MPLVSFLLTRSGPSKGISAEILPALYKIGAIVRDVSANPDAVQVLDAFGLDSLHDEAFLIDLFGAALHNSGSESTQTESTYRMYHEKIFAPWRQMIFSFEPFTSLVIPEELKTENDPRLLSLELTDRADLTVQSVIDVLKSTVNLYEALSRLGGHTADDMSFTIVKIESGTGLTISFKGVADVVKEVKNLITEMWSKHRHKRADEIINHNRAVSSSIQVLTEIEDRVKKHSLPPEDGERLKRAIISNTLTLFRDGALLVDIPHIEVVDNEKLLNGFRSPQLLIGSPVSSGPKSDDENTNSPTENPGRKRAKRKLNS